jgi:hypothetical protein
MGTVSPTDSPSAVPTSSPTAALTLEPTYIPGVPSAVLTMSPTTVPNTATTLAPTSEPTPDPTAYASADPTLSPTLAPSQAPTYVPAEVTPEPSAAPSTVPTANTSAESTSSPTTDSTTWVIVNPSPAPTAMPTSETIITSTESPSSRPSPPPSTEPSYQLSLTPTSAATVNNVSVGTAVLRDLRISAGPRSATITGTFHASTMLDWSANCLVRLAPSRVVKPVSSSQVQLNCYVVATFAASLVEFNATITGLTAATWYEVDWYFEGHASTLTEIRTTQTDFRSGSYGTVGFTGVPSYVVQSGSSQAPYVFSFSIALSVLPATGLNVHPKLTTASGMNVDRRSYGMILPANVTFSSASTGLSSVFYVKIFNASLGQLQLTADLSGPSNADFAVDANVTIALLPNTVALLAPTLVSANFISSGSSLLMTFSGPTDSAGMTSSDGSWSCSMLFIFNNASSCSCLWASTTTVTVLFPPMSARVSYDAFLVPGASTVTLKADKVRAACIPGTNCSANLLSPSMTVVVGTAGTAVSPTIILQGASSALDCSDYVLDASSSYGDGGRAWKNFSWTVTDGGPSMANLLTELAVSLNKGDIYGPVSIPRSYLFPAVLTFTLTLTNFLGAVSTAYKTVTVTQYEASKQVPVQLSIVGSTQLAVVVSAQTVIMANVSFFDCGEVGVMDYAWKMIDLVDQSVVYSGSSSPNPLRLSLPPYALQPLRTYSVTVVASSSSTEPTRASAVVMVTQGMVQAVVLGGYQRSVSVVQDFTLDGSQSRDFNVPSGIQILMFTWSCRIVTPSADFGSDCGYLFTTGSASSAAYVTANSMSVDQTYQFSLVVSSPDGRYDSVSVTVVGIMSGLPIVTMNTQYSSPHKYFMSLNGSKLALFGSIDGNVAVVARWSATFSGQSIPLSGLLTQQSRTFLAAETNGISFPLSIAPYALIANRQYAFTLSSCLVMSLSKCSYASLNVFVAGSPSNGYVTVSPTTGTALLTSFQVSSNGWVDTAEAFPLLYSFLYQATSYGPFLQIRSPYYSKYTYTQLPQGSQKNAYAITLIGVVTNSFGAAANATVVTTVAAAISPSYSNYSKVLGLARASFVQTQEFDAVTSVVNNVASVLTSVDCSSAPNCSQYHRDECETVAHTCGSCLTGYSGVVGPWNGQCWGADAGVRGISDQCSVDSNCIYGNCDPTSGTCQYPAKQCASNSSEECSGHGLCKFVGVSGAEISGSCLINNPLCRPQCTCSDRYGGWDCSKTSEEIVELETLRTNLCLALNETMTKQSYSPALADSLVSSLLLSYSVSYSYNETAHSVCGTVLKFVGGLADNGYLSGVKSSTLQDLTAFLSSFVVVPAPQETTNDVFLAAVNSVLVSIMDASVDGESGTEYTSDSVRFQTEAVLLSDLRLNRTLSAPLSAEEIAYGVVAPAIVLSSGGLDACTSALSFPYAKISVAQLNLNPYSNVLTSISSVLRISSLSDTQTSSQDVASALNSSFLLTFPFSYVQDFAQNNSFPECQQAVGSSAAVQSSSCNGCYLETYTNVNVTFRCTDVTVLCPNGSDTMSNRRLTTVVREVSDSAMSYSTCSVAAGTDFVRTVSINPFEYVSQPALIFISSLLFLVVGGAVVLIKVDIHERNVAVYIQAELIEKRRLEGKKKKDVKNKSGNTNLMLDMGTIVSAVFGMDRYKLQKVGIMPSIAEGGSEISSSESAVTEYGDTDDDFCQPLKKCPPTPKTSKSSSGSSDTSADSGSGLGNFPAENLIAAILPEYLSPLVGNFKWQHSRSLTDKFSFSRYVELILTFHDYTLFLAPTTGVSRLLRWLAMCRGVLVNLFITTMFYMIMYSDNGECFVYTDAASCLAKPSLIQYNKRLCAWNSWNTTADSVTVVHQQCSVTQPPNGTIFLIMTSCLMLMFTVPIDMFLSAAIDEYAGYRPDISKLQNTILGKCFNWRTNDWLGSDAKAIAPAALTQDSITDLSPSVSNCDELEAGLCNAYDLRGLTGFESLSPTIGTHTLVETIHHILKRYDPQEWESRRWKKSLAAYAPKEYILRHYTYDQLAARVHLDRDDNQASSRYQSQVLYDSLQPAEEEVQLMLARIKKYFLGEMDTLSKSQWPFAVAERRDARIAAIMEHLRVYPNGEPMPINMLQTLRYGSSTGRLRSLIETRRSNTQLITDQLLEMKAQNLDDCMDATLLQYFILEHIPLHKRFALQKIFFSYQRLSPPSISILGYITVWLFMYFIFGMLFYWLFVWALRSGKHTLSEWGANFALTMLQDILVLKVAKVLVQYVFVLESTRPQFKQIYRVFMHLGTFLGDSNKVDKREAWQMKQQTTFSVVQYISASCRVAHSHSANNLLAASLLRLVDDVDVANCRADRNYSTNWLQYSISGFFGAVYLVHDYSANQVFDLFMPIIFASFLIANKELYDYGSFYVAIPYVVVIGLVAYLYLFLRPARERLDYVRRKRLLSAQKAFKSNKRDRHSHQAAVWSLSKRFRVHMHRSNWTWFKSRLQQIMDACTLRIVEVSNPFFSSWSRSTFRGSSRNWLTYRGWYDWYHTTPAGVSPCQRDMLWRNLNLPSPFQGVQDGCASSDASSRAHLLRYLAPSSHVRSSDLLSQQARLAQTFSRLAINIPQDVKDMLAGEGVRSSGVRAAHANEQAKVDWAAVLDELSPHELAERIDRSRSGSISARGSEKFGISPRRLSVSSRSFESFDSQRLTRKRTVSFSPSKPSAAPSGRTGLKRVSFSFRSPKSSARVAVDVESISGHQLGVSSDAASRPKSPIVSGDQSPGSPGRIYLCDESVRLDSLFDDLPSSYSCAAVAERDRQVFRSRLANDVKEQSRHRSLIISYSESAPIFYRDQLVSRILNPCKSGPRSTASKYEDAMIELTYCCSRFAMDNERPKNSGASAYIVHDFGRQHHYPTKTDEVSIIIDRYKDKETILCQVLLTRAEAAIRDFYWHHDSRRSKLPEEAIREFSDDLTVFVSQNEFMLSSTAGQTPASDAAARIRVSDEQVLLTYQQRYAHLPLFSNTIIVAIIWRLREEHECFSMESICEAIMLQMEDNKNRYDLNEGIFIDEDNLWTCCNDKLVSGYRDKWVRLDDIHLAVDGATPVNTNVVYVADFIEWLFVKLEMLDGLMHVAA